MGQIKSKYQHKLGQSFVDSLCHSVSLEPEVLKMTDYQ